VGKEISVSVKMTGDPHRHHEEVVFRNNIENFGKDFEGLGGWGIPFVERPSSRSRVSDPN
jgi:hypothetical protein